ncbi:hypothetical protein L7F22_033888 [Adiantum nelumboides]|nr:hypothetical protein [Adiantum nelumboides]
MESPQAHCCNGDWSPSRISFSHGFATKQRISSPAKNPVHDSDFEFSSSIGADLTPKWCMLSADELFSDGKLRLVEGSSECGMSESEPREGGIVLCRGNVGEICSHGEVEDMDAFERKLPKIRLMAKGSEEVADNGSISGRSDSFTQADASRLMTTNRGGLFSVSASCKQGKDRVPTSRADVNSLENLDTSEIAGQCRLPTSREDILPLQKRKNADNIQSPTSRDQESVSAQKLEMGARGSKIRLPTCREELIRAYKSDTCSKAGNRRSREEVIPACGRIDSKAETEVTIRNTRLPPNRESSKAAKTAVKVANQCEETRIPVRWKGEVSFSKRTNEDEHVSQLRRFSRNPRSASMTMGGFSQLANRSCVSLENSRCPSPSRSFSLPATRPASPSGSRSFSVFSASSSSSGYGSKIKDFFKLKKPAPKEAEHSSPSCRLPLSSSSFLPFFKRKEARTDPSDSTLTLRRRDQEQPGSSRQCVSQSGATKEEQRITATSQGQVSSLRKEVDYTSGTTAHVTKPPSEQSTSRNLSPSAASRADALASSAVDKSAPTPARQNNHKGTRASMVSSGGSFARHHMERPTSYTSSVRVTPVLNVPSCITPSLKKAKTSSKPRTFGFDRIFPRGKALVDHTTKHSL